MDNGNDWSEHACPNEDCKDSGAEGKGNVRLERRYGKNRVALLRCRTCRKTFSENRGTPFSGLRMSYHRLYQILTMLVECGSIRGTARALHASKKTVERVVEVAGKHMREFDDVMLRNLEMDQAQCDEFWTYVKSKKGARASIALMRTAARGTSR
jgi:transposase-like protein